MTTNKKLMSKSRELLAGNWETPIVAYLIYMIITGVGGAVGVIFGGPMQFGSSVFSLNLARGKKVKLAQILEGFNNFIESLIAFLLIALYSFLWSLLFVIPGIVAALSYSQTFYVMADDKKIKGTEAMKQSKNMMRGHKWKYFCLVFRFTGWFILSIMTFGVGFIFLVPYMNVSFANFF